MAYKGQISFRLLRAVPLRLQPGQFVSSSHFGFKNRLRFFDFQHIPGPASAGRFGIWFGFGKRVTAYEKIR